MSDTWPTRSADIGPGERYVISRRDKIAVPIIKVAFRLASPLYRKRIHELIVAGMRHGA